MVVSPRKLKERKGDTNINVQITPTKTFGARDISPKRLKEGRGQATIPQPSGTPITKISKGSSVPFLKEETKREAIRRQKISAIEPAKIERPVTSKADVIVSRKSLIGKRVGRGGVIDTPLQVIREPNRLTFTETIQTPQGERVRSRVFEGGTILQKTFREKQEQGKLTFGDFLFSKGLTRAEKRKEAGLSELPQNIATRFDIGFAKGLQFIGKPVRQFSQKIPKRVARFNVPLLLFKGAAETDIKFSGSELLKFAFFSPAFETTALAQRGLVSQIKSFQPSKTEAVIFSTPKGDKGFRNVGLATTKKGDLTISEIFGTISTPVDKKVSVGAGKVISIIPREGKSPKIIESALGSIARSRGQAKAIGKIPFEDLDVTFKADIGEALSISNIRKGFKEITFEQSLGKQIKSIKNIKTPIKSEQVSGALIKRDDKTFQFFGEKGFKDFLDEPVKFRQGKFTFDEPEIKATIKIIDETPKKKIISFTKEPQKNVKEITEDIIGDFNKGFNKLKRPKAVKIAERNILKNALNEPVISFGQTPKINNQIQQLTLKNIQQESLRRAKESSEIITDVSLRQQDILNKQIALKSQPDFNIGLITQQNQILSRQQLKQPIKISNVNVQFKTLQDTTPIQITKTKSPKLQFIPIDLDIQKQKSLINLKTNFKQDLGVGVKQKQIQGLKFDTGIKQSFKFKSGVKSSQKLKTGFDEGFIRKTSVPFSTPPDITRGGFNRFPVPFFPTGFLPETKKKRVKGKRKLSRTPSFAAAQLPAFGLKVFKAPKQLEEFALVERAL